MTVRLSSPEFFSFFSSCPLLLQYNMPDFPCLLFAWWSACPLQLSACPSHCYLAISLPFDTPCLPSPFVSSCLSACPLLLLACRFYSCTLAWAFWLSSLLLFHPVWLPVLWYSFPVGFTHVLLLELSDCPLWMKLVRILPVLPCGLLPVSLFFLTVCSVWISDLMILITQLRVWYYIVKTLLIQIIENAKMGLIYSNLIDNFVACITGEGMTVWHIGKMKIARRNTRQRPWI
jgi:hypothetical protein